jgi:biotin transport system substrate-specific component
MFASDSLRPHKEGEMRTVQSEQCIAEGWEDKLAGASLMSKASRVITLTLLTIWGARLAVPLPFTPVPFTLQTLFVLLSGAWLGKELGAFSQVIYLVLGSAGFPVWAAGAGGISRLWGPTGGYLIACPIAAWMVGLILEGDDGPARTRIWPALVAGLVIIYALGLFQLSLWLDCGAKKAWALGAMPFLPGDLVKAGIVGFLWRRWNPSLPSRAGDSVQ